MVQGAPSLHSTDSGAGRAQANQASTVALHTRVCTAVCTCIPLPSSFWHAFICAVYLCNFIYMHHIEIEIDIIRSPLLSS